MEKYYKWTKASEKLPPINERVIIKDGERIYTDSTNLGWDRRVTDYEWLEEAKNISSSPLLADSLPLSSGRAIETPMLDSWMDRILKSLKR